MASFHDYFTSNHHHPYDGTGSSEVRYPDNRQQAEQHSFDWRDNGRALSASEPPLNHAGLRSSGYALQSRLPREPFHEFVRPSNSAPGSSYTSSTDRFEQDNVQEEIPSYEESIRMLEQLRLLDASVPPIPARSQHHPSNAPSGTILRDGHFDGMQSGSSYIVTAQQPQDQTFQAPSQGHVWAPTYAASLESQRAEPVQGFVTRDAQYDTLPHQTTPPVDFDDFDVSEIPVEETGLEVDSDGMRTKAPDMSKPEPHPECKRCAMEQHDSMSRSRKKYPYKWPFPTPNHEFLLEMRKTLRMLGWKHLRHMPSSLLPINKDENLFLCHWVYDSSESCPNNPCIFNHNLPQGVLDWLIVRRGWSIDLANVLVRCFQTHPPANTKPKNYLKLYKGPPTIYAKGKMNERMVNTLIQAYIKEEEERE